MLHLILALPGLYLLVGAIYIPFVKDELFEAIDEALKYSPDYNLLRITNPKTFTVLRWTASIVSWPTVVRGDHRRPSE